MKPENQLPVAFLAKTPMPPVRPIGYNASLVIQDTERISRDIDILENSKNSYNKYLTITNSSEIFPIITLCSARQILCIRRESMSPREDDISPTSTSVETRTEGSRECKKEYGKESKAGRNEKEKAVTSGPTFALFCKRVCRPIRCTENDFAGSKPKVGGARVCRWEKFRGLSALLDYGVGSCDGSSAEVLQRG
ncbi:hypothetical protein V1478_016026 [Vespula squamosa]|uniref:Uncharacterized protein n=1 Tax=Vespula squamosa TaxID=30214 RepID=A0ABD2A2H4_VESSQ